ncbi:epoxide hydrolase family protein [Agrococcus baldri]|uniref:Microsomal epoxide hydrolase n=1 Tax=Agrococcus baldri TaxID=153730 RepID=A0AA87RJX5_9MICO|nr:epoxide hydrolase [Agrococcus baldri]GEK81551.1 microsomal epoxide hydrolase [Agrococcus baldri]
MTTTADTAVRPFTIDIPQADIDELHERLARTRWAPTFAGDTPLHGVPQATLRRLAEAWQSFDWRDYEARLNALDHVETVIDGQRVHAVHAPSPHPDATPVILTHGWPHSFLEHLHLIEPLTRPELHGGDAADAFHVVIASVPGFGFSTPLGDGVDVSDAATAARWLELMTRLGYDRFVAHGGDVGAGISPEIGRLAPDRVIGVHITGTLGGFVSAEEGDTMQLSELERDRIARVDAFMQHEFGYIALQGTRPALLGAMVADSPVAQLAWIYDKQQAWSWPAEREATEVLGLEWVLANASLYWFTRSAGSAAYVGYAQGTGWGEPEPPSGVPTAAIQFAHDVGIRAKAEQEHTIVRWTDVDRGGHFGAMEEPELVVDDLRAFVRSLR